MSVVAHPAGDMGRYGEIWRDVGRYEAEPPTTFGAVGMGLALAAREMGRDGERWGGMGRDGGRWGEMGRDGAGWGDMWGLALAAALAAAC